MKWNPDKWYEMEKVKFCNTLTVTAVGELVSWVETESFACELRWYDQQGKLIQTFKPPPQCGHIHLNVLALEVGGKQQVALSCPRCQCIWLGSQDKELWTMAWQATGKEGGEKRKDQPVPDTMCQGKPGQIIAGNRQGDEKSVSVFDITQIPFRVVVPQMKLGMHVCDLCYCELLGVGGALAVTDVETGYKVSMFSLDSGELIWSVDKKKLPGARMNPHGVCSDNRGRLYVADYDNHRIFVFSAASGSVLQVMQGRGHLHVGWVAEPGITVYGPDIRYKNNNPHWGVVSGSVLQEFNHPKLEETWYLCWHEQSKSIIAGTFSGGKITRFQITF